jgi:hypothetical protein
LVTRAKRNSASTNGLSCRWYRERLWLSTIALLACSRVPSSTLPDLSIQDSTDEPLELAKSFRDSTVA